VAGKALISSRTLFLTPAGWLSPGFGSNSVQIVGLDRHGRPAVEQIAFQATGLNERPVFIGTSDSCGFLSPRSALMDHSGRSWTTERIVRDGSVGEMRFEHPLTTDRIRETRVAAVDDNIAQSLWRDLAYEAARHDDSNAWIRQRAKPLPSDKRHKDGAWRCIPVGSRRYWHLQFSALAAAVQRPGVPDFLDGIQRAFGNEEQECQFMSSSSALAMHVLMLTRLASADSSLAYDSLQHSCSVRIVPSDPEHSAYSRGLCAFIAPRENAQWQISWNDSSWTPVCGGGLLKAQV
jgi:hypothetical protein